MYLQCCFALNAGVDQQVTLPGHGKVEDRQRQGAIAGGSQAAHVLTPTHCVDDHRPVLEHMEWKHKLTNAFIYILMVVTCML